MQGIRRGGVSARARYARILRTPHVRPLILAALVARLPIGMDSLAIVLFLRQQTGSYAIAGVVAAAFALGAGAGQPLAARLIDRFGQRPVLLPMAACTSSGSARSSALGFARRAGSGARPRGALSPACSSRRSARRCGRCGEHAARASPTSCPTAYALDSVLVEMLFVLGPLLTAIGDRAALPRPRARPVRRRS